MRLPDPPAGLEPGAGVWIYLRYSSEHQTIESQAHTMRQWCAQHRLTIAREFRDEARSGKTDAGRDGFNTMIASVEHGDARTQNIRAVVFWSFARMARNTNDAEYFKSLLRRHGLIVFTLADDIPTGALAPVFEAFAHVKDQDYRKRLSDEIKRGLEYRISRGVPHSGSKPRIGYRHGERVYLGPKMKRVNGVLKQVGERYGCRLEQDPETRERVTRAWDMMLAGASDYAIHRATRVTCSYAVLGEFFRSITYCGAVRCGDLVNWNAHDAYVTRAQWEQVQQMRRERAPRPATPALHPARRHNPANFLSGILHCGACGKCLTYGSNGYHRGQVSRYLRCRNRHDNDCPLRTIQVNVVHGAVLDWCAAHVFTPARFYALRDAINAALNGDRTQARAARDESLTRCARLDREIDNLIAHIKRFGPDADINTQLRRIRSERDRARADLTAAENEITAQRLTVSDSVLDWLAANLRTELASAAPSRVRDVIRSVIHRLDLRTDDTLQISYSLQPILNAFTNALKSQWKASLQTPFPLPTYPHFTTNLHTTQLQLTRPRSAYRTVAVAHV